MRLSVLHGHRAAGKTFNGWASRGWARSAAIVGAALVSCGLVGALRGAPVTVYETGFEPPDFLAGYALDGQGDWLAPWLAWPTNEIHTSWIATNFFENSGQAAVIGSFAPDSAVSSVSVYRPLFIDPVGNGRPLVIFTVTMAILYGTAPDPNSFRWVVYNRGEADDPEQQRLFSLDFDLATTEIVYLLGDDAVGHETGYRFLPEILYDLALFMNFESNVWSATLNDVLIVNAAPITPDSDLRTLDLGDIDAAWVLGADSESFGDSYMVFDDFRVLADVAAPLPCRVDPVEFLEDGSFLVQLTGEPGRAYALEASGDLLEWTSIATNTPSDGAFVVLDPEVAGWPRQFYRGRAVWP